MNAFDEKMKLIGEKIEEKMSIEKFSEEKDIIYKEINHEKNIIILKNIKKCKIKKVIG